MLESESVPVNRIKVRNDLIAISFRKINRVSLTLVTTDNDFEPAGMIDDTRA